MNNLANKHKKTSFHFHQKAVNRPKAAPRSSAWIRTHLWIFQKELQ